MSVNTESEKKRLQSLKEKKHAFKIKGQLIQQALSNLNAPKNKKIIFDDDVNEQGAKSQKKKINLFDSDEDNDDNKKEDALWTGNEFNANKRRKVVLGSDMRFTLDDRFTEENHPVEEATKTGTDECDLRKEKEKEFDILENILGKPLKKAPEKSDTKSAKKGLMIRYDPTENEHCEYEVKPVQPETKERSNKKKKREKSMPDAEEAPSVEVSKDIYYAVSDTLTESLKQKEEFSLLKTYGKDNSDTGCGENNDASAAEKQDRKFRFNFTANMYKHDSSDEDIDEAADEDKQVTEEIEDDKNRYNLFGHKDTLFFDEDDVRFNEAAGFFSTQAEPKDEFNNLRRKLKLIVRTKIRNNEKQHQPWGKKRKVKKFLQ